MSIRCIAVDDEKLALDLLEDNIRRMPNLHLVATCNNALEATTLLEREKIDVVFMDIQMPGLTGIQFLKTIKVEPRPVFIFITAYAEFALEGFNLDVIDYLLKPVSFERFVKAVNKASEYIQVRKIGTAHQDSSFFFVHAEYNLVKIVKHDITRVEGLKDYIKIFLTTSNRPIITRLSLKAIEEMLPKDKFFRVHKSYIVNLERIVSIRKGRIKLADGEVPVSDSYSASFYTTIGHKHEE
jgi:DNA-binding LytR/AlgR family response regulator